jgi:hypothetical protein
MSRQHGIPRGRLLARNLVLDFRPLASAYTGFTTHQAIIALSLFALALGVRVMAQVNLRRFAIFYNAPLFVIYLIVLSKTVQRGAAKAAGPTANVIRLALCFQFLLIVCLVTPWPLLRLYNLSTRIGTIAVSQAEAQVVPNIISFMERQRDAGRRVEILPEMPFLYVATGLTASTRWYEILPGILDPEAERDYIRLLSVRRPDVIILTNRSTYEYAAPYFGIDYAQPLLSWITTNYIVAGRFGDFERHRDARFAALVYLSKGLISKHVALNHTAAEDATETPSTPK